jgi:hypothetical protein
MQNPCPTIVFQIMSLAVSFKTRSKGAAIAKHSAPRFLAWEGVQWTGEAVEFFLNTIRTRTLAIPRLSNSVMGNLAQGEKPSTFSW